MPFVAPLSLALSLFAQDPMPGTELRGVIEAERPAEGARRVLVWELRDGRELGKDELFSRAPDHALVADANGRFATRVSTPQAAVFTFVDVDGDGRWTPAVPEPCGWRRLVEASAGELALTLSAPTHLPRGDRVVDHGALRWMRGYPVVQLDGSAAERGRAHGLLLAPQIVDFFRCYVLEDRLRDAAAHGEFARFLEAAFAWPAEFLAEIDALLDGMQQSGADLTVPELGRAFGRTELLAINAYIETRAMRSSCTQFACWGERTRGTDVDGGTIAGRNMDGEIDVRRVTVSHFVLFAVTPREPGRARYVSMMWPGFVGTLSGFNEHGVHCMENAGGTGPGPVVDRLQPISWTMREALARFDATAGPTDFERLLEAHANSAGGACGPGCIVLFALPRTAATRAWVLEGDRFGHATRLPAQVAPALADAILASNHHHRYGVDARQPDRSFGQAPSFSSRWRYEAGQQKLAAWARTGRAVGSAEMKELLRTVAHGTTEHSIVTRPDQLEFDVAVASMEAEPWDAPYRAWTTFRFHELFAAAAGVAPGEPTAPPTGGGQPPR